jgi:acyl-CoA thioesterase
MAEAGQQPTPAEIGSWMEQNDRFASLLGIRLDSSAAGRAQASMEVKPEMLNAVGILQGGATFTLADFAFAVASNSHGTVAVSLNAQITYTAASQAGDRLVATATEVSRTRSTGLYQIEVYNGDGQLVAHFTGTVYRRKDGLEEWMKTETSEGEQK